MTVPEEEDFLVPVPDFLDLRFSAFFPVPDRYLRRTWVRRVSNDWSSVAVVVVVVVVVVGDGCFSFSSSVV